MLSREYKSAFGDLARPLSLRLHGFGVTADHLTAVGLLFSAVAALAYGTGHFALGGLLFLLSGASDALDGPLARSAGEATPFGSFIDSVADRYSDIFVFGGLAVHYAASPVLILVLASLGGSFLVSYTRAKAENIIDRCEVGLMERPERLLLLVAASFFGFMVPALWILAVAANLTALHRIWHTWRTVQRGGGAP